MSDLQLELLRVGLITQKQYDRQKVQDERRNGKDHRKMVAAAQDPSASFPSLRFFMDHAKKKLRENPSSAMVGRLITQMHQVADNLRLKPHRRKKAHAFLAKVGEGLRSRLPEDHSHFLDEVFLEADPKLVTED